MVAMPPVSNDPARTLDHPEQSPVNTDRGDTRTSVDWWFCVSWLLLNAIGLGAGDTLGLWLLTRASISDPIDQLVFGATVGLALGAAQWIRLRKILVRSWMWIPLTGLGWLIGQMLWSLMMTEPIPNVLGGLVAFILGRGFTGLSVGLLQWFVLRNRFSGGSIWILATVVGSPLGQYVFVLLRPAPPPFWAPAGAGAITAMVTSLALFLLVRRRTPIPR